MKTDDTRWSQISRIRRMSCIIHWQKQLNFTIVFREQLRLPKGWSFLAVNTVWDNGDVKLSKALAKILVELHCCVYSSVSNFKADITENERMTEMSREEWESNTSPHRLWSMKSSTGIFQSHTSLTGLAFSKSTEISATCLRKSLSSL